MANSRWGTNVHEAKQGSSREKPGTDDGRRKDENCAQVGQIKTGSSEEVRRLGLRQPSRELQWHPRASREPWRPRAEAPRHADPAGRASRSPSQPSRQTEDFTRSRDAWATPPNIINCKRAVVLKGSGPWAQRQSVVMKSE